MLSTNGIQDMETAREERERRGAGGDYYYVRTTYIGNSSINKEIEK